MIFILLKYVFRFSILKKKMSKRTEDAAPLAHLFSLMAVNGELACRKDISKKAVTSNGSEENREHSPLCCPCIIANDMKGDESMCFLSVLVSASQIVYGTNTISGWETLASFMCSILRQSLSAKMFELFLRIRAHVFPYWLLRNSKISRKDR